MSEMNRRTSNYRLVIQVPTPDQTVVKMLKAVHLLGKEVSESFVGDTFAAMSWREPDDEAAKTTAGHVLIAVGAIGGEVGEVTLTTGLYAHLRVVSHIGPVEILNPVG